eukprot:693489_1
MAIHFGNKHPHRLQVLAHAQKHPIITVNTDEDEDNELQTENVESRIESKLMISSWLDRTVGLPQFYVNFVSNGYESTTFVAEITDISWLEEIGIESVEHQKHIMD